MSHVQAYNLVVGGAMTDPKGDRSKPPHQQEDADLFVRVVERRAIKKARRDRAIALYPF